MKKSNFYLITVGLLLLVFVAVASVSAATITVKSPIGGETWQRGTTHMVTWSYTDFPAGAPVKIVLLNAGAEVGSIVTSTSIGAGGTGSYSWSIGSASTLSTGNNFKVKVQSVNQPTVFGTSPAVFTLTPAGTTTPPAVGTHFGGWQDITTPNKLVGSFATTATTDGFVVGVCEGRIERGFIWGSVGGNTGMYDLGGANTQVGDYNTRASITMPVRKGDIWVVTWKNCDSFVHLRWLPLVN